MADTAKLTHVVEVNIGTQMINMLAAGQPVTLAFESISLQVRVLLDGEVKQRLLAPPKAEDNDKTNAERIADSQECIKKLAEAAATELIDAEGDNGKTD